MLVIVLWKFLGNDFMCTDQFPMCNNVKIISVTETQPVGSHSEAMAHSGRRQRDENLKCRLQYFPSSSLLKKSKHEIQRIHILITELQCKVKYQEKLIHSSKLLPPLPGLAMFAGLPGSLGKISLDLYSALMLTIKRPVSGEDMITQIFLDLYCIIINKKINPWIKMTRGKPPGLNS